jgi:hypothetical protein
MEADMQIKQVHIQGKMDMNRFDPLLEIQPDVIMVFGDARFFEDYQLGTNLQQKFPQALIIGCSTAGEIVNDAVYDNTLVATALASPDGQWFLTSAQLEDASRSLQAGEKVGRDMASYGPHFVFVVAPGLKINGSDGLMAELGPDVILTGGLAGDGLNFRKTYVLGNATVSNDQIIALGLKDPTIEISYGTQGGWQPFGPYRQVTRAKNNILYELDGKSALALYKKYLGDKAKDLPGSGLLYPLDVIEKQGDEDSKVRSILDINEADGSITLAGDVCEGHQVRLMHAKTESLIEGARRAGQDASGNLALSNAVTSPALGILVSCIGRKVVMGDDVDEEVRIVKDAFGGDPVLTGFYSYGEICPFSQKNRRSTLHNQTMTVTRLTQSRAPTT